MKTHLHVVTENNPRSSAAREHLRELLEQRAQITARIADLQAANGRLNESFSKAAAAKAELDVFEAKSAEAMLAWSKVSAGNAPVIDSEMKRRLMSEVAVTNDQAAAAEVARRQLAVSIQRETAATRALDVPIAHAVVQVISEIATGPKLEELRAVVALAVAKQAELRQAVEAIFTIARTSGDMPATKPIFDEAAALHEALRVAAAPPAPDGAPAFEAWTSFAAELRVNPSAELKS